MKRFLADASTLIALAATGHLDDLKRIVGRVHVTTAVLEEVLGERPGATAIQQAVDAGWILTAASSPTEIPGLGPGEATTMSAAKPGDIVILDDRAARMEARSRGLRVTGVLGLIVHGAQTRKLARQDAQRILDDLAQGNFRMSADLYRWAVAKLGEVPS